MTPRVTLHASRLESRRPTCFAVFAGLATLASLGMLSGGCKDSGVKSAEFAKGHAESLAALVEKDVGEVERGLPEGAKKGTAAFVGKEGVEREPAAVRRGLQKVQREVPDLLVAKSTFFALVDPKGIAIRNNLETDAMAGQDIFTLFPTLRDSATKGFVSTSGTFPNAISLQGPDRTWVAASPIKGADGQLAAYFVTGWSYRRFAYHLQESLRGELKEKLLNAGDKGKLPILYVAIFDATGVYSAPQTPDLNEKALKDLAPVEKTKGGLQTGTVNLEGRSFGWAAVRTPKLGPDMGVALLRSEI